MIKELKEFLKDIEAIGRCNLEAVRIATGSRNMETAIKEMFYVEGIIDTLERLSKCYPHRSGEDEKIRRVAARLYGEKEECAVDFTETFEREYYKQ